jgi:microcompartment protein CcmK/EutM
MKLGRIQGKVWATKKDAQLIGIKLYLMQPLDKNLNPMGREIIAADAIGVGEGDLVYWVGSREATFAIAEKNIPSDASIVGFVDSVHVAVPSKVKKNDYINYID